MRPEEKIAKLLIKEKKTLSVAESCTGGLVAHRLTNISGSSDFLKIGVVAYSNDTKIKILKVPSKLIRGYGAVSPEVAIAMAKGVRKIHQTDFGVGITGIAGPSGGTKTKPVGLVFICIQTQTETLCIECRFRGNRSSVKTQAATQALKLLQEFLS